MFGSIHHEKSKLPAQEITVKGPEVTASHVHYCFTFQMTTSYMRLT